MAAIQFTHSRDFSQHTNGDAGPPDPMKASSVDGFWRLGEGDEGVPLDLSAFNSRVVHFHFGREGEATLQLSKDGGRYWHETVTAYRDRHDTCQISVPAIYTTIRPCAIVGAVKVELTARNVV